MLQKYSARALRRQWQLYHGVSRVAVGTTSSFGRYTYPVRGFHSTQRLRVVKPVLLADIGEGIVECEIIQWFVEPEARVEEFSPLCEVQSDKASVEITSRFSGIVKKLHYEAGDMAKVGKPFVDIDMQGEVDQKTLEALTPTEPKTENRDKTSAPGAGSLQKPAAPERVPEPAPAANGSGVEPSRPKGKHATLATPAVRHLSKELKIDIADIDGTGRDGRVLKEDIYKFVEARDSGAAAVPPAQPSSPARPQHSPGPPEVAKGPQVETRTPLTKTQEQMFKAMTRSLTIPHFLYADEIDFTLLSELRARLNRVLAQPTTFTTNTDISKLSYLPFIIKAVSMALHQYPILNARVEVGNSTSSSSSLSKPALIHRTQHNIGVAMDTPTGLLVPVIKNVASLNILSIASELQRLQSLAVAGKLSHQDMSGGTVTVSNIGSIGGTYCSPVIVDGQVAILGIGRIQTIPAFVHGEEMKVVKKQVCNFSWSADHRVVDGATMARAAGVVRALVEEPDVMVMHLR